MKPLTQYDNVSSKISILLTKNYSTSFSLGIRMFDRELRAPIAGIYGFVRLVDEIVDTFHHIDKEKFLNQIIEETNQCISSGLSLNPILHTFGQVVNNYKIDWEYIESFLNSMKMDLEIKNYSEAKYKEYIYGSAEVIGLFCLKVFLEKEPEKFDELKISARALGSAFQKINFLRDIRSDFEERGRIYFPNVEFQSLSNSDKLNIERDIESDFMKAKEGISRLPNSSKFGVKLAYIFYYNLFQKIRKASVDELVTRRIRISNFYKFLLFIKIYFQTKFSSLLNR
ncbi:MAG: phytoene/squalene synthase family protein [Saprospiraceae bacterium]